MKVEDNGKYEKRWQRIWENVLESGNNSIIAR